MAKAEDRPHNEPMEMDRDQLADFLRRRREALQPEDVGLVAGPRRRTQGLRREEVAALANMSTDYYGRLEQRRGPQPSEQMLSSIARGMRLSQDERDHLYRLAGHPAPPRAFRSDHVSPGLMKVLDRLDTPAQVMSDIGETLAQNELARALVGDQMNYTGARRSAIYRWFSEPEARLIYPEDDHELHTGLHVAGLRVAMARSGNDPEITALVDRLIGESPEFAERWQRHEVDLPIQRRKRMVHPTIGVMELECQVLVAENEAQVLLVYTATPGTEDHEKLRLLSVIGTQRMTD